MIVREQKTRGMLFSVFFLTTRITKNIISEKQEIILKVNLWFFSPFQNANDSKPRFVVVRSEPLDFSIPHNTSNIVFNTFTLSGILLENMTSLVLRIRSNITAGFR